MQNRPLRMIGSRAVLAALVGLACGSCGREAANLDRFVPAPGLARTALEAVLIDWKEGRPAAPIERLAVTVNVVDQHRRPGQVLIDFEILGETPSSSGRCLIVRLKYGQPEGEETIRYVVVGIDPLWVFRQEDLDLMNHWDHPMPPAPPHDSETGEDEKQVATDIGNRNDEIQDAADDRDFDSDAEADAVQ
jgi:hypothetical protein